MLRLGPIRLCLVRHTNMVELLMTCISSGKNDQWANTNAGYHWIHIMQ
jgi:hypothetical protein